MKQDEYLPIEAYENQPAHSTRAGFTVFFDEGSQNYFFALVDDNGNVLLRSEGYQSVTGRDTGIDSVIINRGNREFYSVKEESGDYFLSLRAVNDKEIARSGAYRTEAGARELVQVLTGDSSAAAVSEGDQSETFELPTSAAIGAFAEDPASERKAEQPKIETARRPARSANKIGSEALISLRGLKVHFDMGGGGLLDRITGGSAERKIVKAVDGVSFDIEKGETLGLVGESGCGKSTLGKALLRLTPITDGRVLYKGKDLAHASDREMREQRRHLQMIFQDPYASLNPRMTVGNIIGEPIRTFGLANGKSVERMVQDLMETVGMSRRFIKRYPHEFSGGQRQRIGIARALAVDPEFIVADEPISALDVSIQAQIMNLMDQLQAEKNLTYMFISHDLRAIRHVADRVAVMYLGKIVELADGKEIYSDSLHPYSKALISAVPVPDPEIEAKRERIILTGDVPSPINPPSGCRFHTRCPYAISDCGRIEPELAEIKPNHFAACIRISPEKPNIEENV